MYVRDLEFVEEGRDEMIEYIKSLGPNVSQSAPVAWVMDDFRGGTFPPWFKNVTEKTGKKGANSCARPCAHGVFNKTTGMWGCPKEHHGVPLKIASPLQENIVELLEVE